MIMLELIKSKVVNTQYLPVMADDFYNVGDYQALGSGNLVSGYGLIIFQNNENWINIYNRGAGGDLNNRKYLILFVTLSEALIKYADSEVEVSESKSGL